LLRKIKDWLLMILLALVGLLATVLFARKPDDWAKEKEKEVEGRKNAINRAKEQAKRAEKYYKEMKKKHDEKIAEGSKKPGEPDINSPDDAANYIDDILSDIKSSGSSVRESKKN